MEEYKLNKKKDKDSFVYVEIRKGMYSLPQAGRIVHNQLKEHLTKFGYEPVPITPGLWKHKT
eukprot:14746384-Ditylum_brightwellii.AAC.1